MTEETTKQEDQRRQEPFPEWFVQNPVYQAEATKLTAFLREKRQDLEAIVEQLEEAERLVWTGDIDKAYDVFSGIALKSSITSLNVASALAEFRGRTTIECATFAEARGEEPDSSPN